MQSPHFKPKRPQKKINRTVVVGSSFVLPFLFFSLLSTITAIHADDTAMTLSADHIEGDNATLEAHGNVKAHFNRYQLCAGKVIYDPHTGLVRAVEEVRLKRNEIDIRGSAAQYDRQQQQGSIEQFDFEVAKEGLHIRGDHATWNANEIHANNARISSCPPESPDWHLRAGAVTTNNAEQTARIQDAVLEIVGIPVFYLPQMNLYYGEDKKSGFLWPHLRFGSGSGVGFDLPYYVALADHYDLTFTPKYRSQHGLELGSEFRFLTAKSQGTLNIATALFDYAGRGREQLDYAYQDGKWEVHLAAENVSDATYLRDYSDHNSAASTRNLPRTAVVSYQEGQFFARAAVEHFKTLDDSLTAPHRAVPQIDIGSNGSGAIYDWQTSAQYARFHHNHAAAGTRVLWRGESRLYVPTAADISFSPALGAHVTHYREDGNTHSFFVPQARLDSEKRYRNLWNDNNDQYDQLRLRAAVVYTPTRQRQNNAPLYDTAVREQTSENLFESNRFIGADRIADAKFIAYGGGYHLFNQHDGNEAFFIGAAQQYHFADAKIILPTNDPAVKQGFGNILIDSRLRLGQTWDIAAAAEWDAQRRTMQRFYTEIHGEFSNARLLHLRYLADDNESLLIGGSTPVSDWLEVAAQTDYLLDEDRFSRSQLSLRLRDSCNCWNISFTVSDTVVAKGENDVEFSFGVELSGLGSVGNRYESVLEQFR